MKKWIKKICIALSLLTVFAFGSCGKKSEENSSSSAATVYSDVRGKFLSNKVIGLDEVTLRVTSDKDKTDTDTVKYMFWTDYYPFNTIGGGKGETVHWDASGIGRYSYEMDQTLQLKRDFTYRYQYAININCANEWGGQIATLEVDIQGTFSYEESGEGYLVDLSTPTAGKETVYGCRLIDSLSNIHFSHVWSKNSTPGYQIDIAYALSQGQTLDEYVSARQVYVWQNEDGEKIIEHDLYDNQIFNKLFLKYSTY